MKTIPLPRRITTLLSALGICTLLSGNAFSQTNNPVSGPEILQKLREFRTLGSVLYIAAHPDDENTQLIAYLARGRNYRTAYLSVTRGDGGQNVLGGEFNAQLGVIRTEELLAARRLDGGRQFFTRAIDFGYSKDYRETLSIWDKQQVLSDVVRVIRTFQSDVIVAGFSTQQTPGQHGHHVASAVLAGEAFKLAGDTNAFPDQLTYLKPWQPKRLVQNVRFGGNRGGTNNAADIRIDASGTDPVTGMSFAELAGRSRAMHKSQGFDNFRIGGGNGPQYQSFNLLDGPPATNDIMDSVDTSWSRIPGGDEIRKQTDEIIAAFDEKDPLASVDALLALHAKLEQLADGPFVQEKRKLLDRILQNCLGLTVTTTVPNAEVVPGETVTLHTTVQSRMDVGWVETRTMDNTWRAEFRSVKAGTPSTHDLKTTFPQTASLSQPYWLREDPTVGTFRVDDPKLIGSPESPSTYPLTHVFSIGLTNAQFINVEDEPVQAGTASGKFEARRTLKVVAPVALHCVDEVALFAPGSTHEIAVEATAAHADVKGALSLDAPDGWKVSPATQPFDFATAGQHQTFSFKVTAPSTIASAELTARAKVGNITYDNQRIEISYPHIPAQLLQPPARTKAVTLDLAIRGKRVGYIPGAGDSVAAALTQMGYDVTTLTGADLTTNRLKDLDAVVIGIRAFNVRNDLVANLPALFAYAENGGTVIEQYNRPGNDLKTEQLTPYSLKISGDRVTDEKAAITFLAPDHPVLNTPNKITEKDFAGWIQERGIYFPNQWDEHFTPILACNDAGEAPKQGSLLVAHYGKGYFVYTGLVFFRELPEGVPGAYRLFANLVSLGK